LDYSKTHKNDSLFEESQYFGRQCKMSLLGNYNMSSDKPNEEAEFDRWLNQRMKESNLTPKEMKEFAEWLEIRQRNIEAESK
jgi:hypothetical protein